MLERLDEKSPLAVQLIDEEKRVEVPKASNASSMQQHPSDQAVQEPELTLVTKNIVVVNIQIQDEITKVRTTTKMQQNVAVEHSFEVPTVEVIEKDVVAPKVFISTRVQYYR